MDLLQPVMLSSILASSILLLSSEDDLPSVTPPITTMWIEILTDNFRHPVGL
jgi:hypothetical protein